MELFPANKKLIFLVAASCIAGFTAISITPDKFWLLGVFFVILIILCKYEAGLYLLIPLVLLEAQRIDIKTSESLRVDFVGIYFPVLIVVFFSWLFHRLSKLPGGLKRYPPNIDYYAAILLAWATISLLWTPSVQHGLIQLVRFAGNIFLFYMVADAVSNEKIHNRVVNIFIFMGWAISIAAILSITLYDIHEYPYVSKFGNWFVLKLNFFVYYVLYHPRAMGILPHNATAGILNLIIGLTFAKFVYDKRVWCRSFLLLSMILMTLSVIETKSRGALVGYLSMWFFMLASIPSQRKHFIRNLLFFSILFTVVYLGVFWENIFTPRLSASAAGHSIKTRMGYWIKGYKILSERHNAFGMGVGGLKYYFHPLNIPHAHNLYLSFFFDFGIVGFVAVFALFAKIGKWVRRSMESFDPTYNQIMLRGTLGGLVAIGVHGLIDSEYNIAVFWFYLGFLVASVRLIGIESRGMQNDQAV